MNLGRLIGGIVGGSAALLLYGALVEVDRLKKEKLVLRLPRWPDHLAGFRIALLADMHLRDQGTLRLTQRAVEAALDEQPDMVAIVGDFVGRWKPDSPWMIGEALGGLKAMSGNAVAVPGNRDYLDGDPSVLDEILRELDIRLLRNENWNHLGINWLGVDSANALQADPIGTFEQVSNADPMIALWHEPDLVEWLPEGPVLMLSGHSHGGQFTTPWGWAPVKSGNGEKYLRGYFPQAPTPLYVSRGLGTTGPPSRLFCRPEVTILDLLPA